ncbi:MAG: hypothetical protein U0610_24005 [bacterium]
MKPPFITARAVVSSGLLALVVTGAMGVPRARAADSSDAAATATASASSDSIARALADYWGESRFVIAGSGAAGYDWAAHDESNTFTAEIEPLFLFRITDKALVEAEAEFELPSDGETEVNLEYGQLDYLFNDYVTLVAGKFLTPFGDFNERIQPTWINKLASTPLPFRHEEGLLPFSEVGAQLRGGIPLMGDDGVDLEYALYVSNGPKFADAGAGSLLEAANNADINKSKAFGARIGIRPLPLSAELGRLKIGLSTYNGTWDDQHQSLWLNVWGADAAYKIGYLELRGEFVDFWRELPDGASTEHRQGGYAQAAYKLTPLGLPILDRTELVLRYSQQNQPAAPEDAPDQPNPRIRQLAAGIDYWFSPMLVFKAEYDFDERKAEKEGHEVHAQFAFGF